VENHPFTDDLPMVIWVICNSYLSIPESGSKIGDFHYGNIMQYLHCPLINPHFPHIFAGKQLMGIHHYPILTINGEHFLTINGD